MRSDLSKKVASLEEGIEKVKALAIKARSQRRLGSPSDREQLTCELQNGLRDIIAVAEEALETLKGEEGNT